MALTLSSRPARLPRDRPPRRPRKIACTLLALLTACPIASATLPGQVGGPAEPPEEPLLPEIISRDDVQMRGRYVRQWKQADGTVTLLFNGGFEMTFGRRQMSAVDAVVWISPQLDEEGRKFYELTVYLSENAQVLEPAGTLIEDAVLLVTNIRTRGRLIKFHDAHSPESLEATTFYQRALHDRRLIESGRPTGAEMGVAGPPAETGREPRLPPPVIRYALKNLEPAVTPAGETVYVSTGRVYFSRTGDPNSPVLEIQADSAVIFPAPRAAEALLRTEEGPSPPPRPAEETQPSPATQPAGPQREPEVGPLEVGELGERIRAVYLEGDVILSLGDRFIRAARLYYDFELSRALILDGVLRADIPERNIPLYIRAAEIRQLSAREFLARRARVSTSEFYTPHYHVGAEKVYLRDLTARDTAGRPAGRLRGAYEMHSATLNVEGLLIAWWPLAAGTLEQSETLVRRLRTGYSDENGVEIETAWHLFNLLGVQAPPGVDATLRLDWFTRRGPAVGLDADYLQDEYFGLLRGYYLYDQGEDNLGPLRDGKPDSRNRGRILWRHRHYLPDNWELTLEFSYISDPTFLEEWRKSEFFEGKEQETAIYLKRAKDTEAISLLANWRLLDFTTQTEHLPDMTYRRIGDTLLDALVSYTEARVGAVRYRPDDRRFFDDRRADNTGLTDVTFRTDGREELELPLKLGPLNVVPFASVRGSYWDGQPLAEGGLWRGLGTYGVRSSTSFSRVYDDVESELLDVHRIRHIIRPEALFWWSHSNTRSELITPFDYGIETLDDFYGGLIALRQTWQTRRGEGERQRTVDLLTLDLEAALFGQTPPTRPEVPGGGDSPGFANWIRPENSRPRNYLAGDLTWRISDTTSLLYDFNFDLDDAEFDRHDVSVAVERLPRLAYVFGWRYAHDVDLGLLGGGFNYKMTEKHILATRAWWDIDRGELGEFSISYVRKLPRWYAAVTFEIDEVFEDTRVSLSLWPEGVPEWTLGSRRFTGLGTSTGIRP